MWYWWIVCTVFYCEILVPLGRLEDILIYYLHMCLTPSSNFAWRYCWTQMQKPKVSLEKGRLCCKNVKFEISVNASSFRHGHWLHFSIFLHFGSVSFPVECTVDFVYSVIVCLLLKICCSWCFIFLYWVGINTNHLLLGPLFLRHLFYKIRANGHWFSD